MRMEAVTVLEPSLTFEVCGQPGQCQESNYIRTLCDEHAEGRGVFTGWEGE